MMESEYYIVKPVLTNKNGRQYALSNSTVTISELAALEQLVVLRMASVNSVLLTCESI